MSKYRRWAVLASVGALTSACQLGLEGRACSVSASGEADECAEGFACCSDATCRTNCSGIAEQASESGSPDQTSDHDAGAGQFDVPPYGDGPPPTAVRLEVGPGGGELVLGGASVHIPEGALPELTPIELAVTGLPQPLPPRRELASPVYLLSSAQPSFGQPATFEVPVSDSFSHLMVLELGDVGWQPVLGARFDAQPGSDPLVESPQGTVSWSTQHRGFFVVVVVPHQNSMALALGDAPYSYACGGGGGSSIAVSDDNGGMGPSFSTQNTSANVPECPWPTSEPGLWIDVLFRNFVPSEGLALGSWDLAAPESISALRVRFIASVEEEPPVGQERPYQYYDSTTPVAGAEGPIPSVTFEGFYQSPIARGSISVVRLPTVANTGYSSEAELLGTDASLYQIALSNVTLSATDQAIPNPDEPFPATVSIASATLTYAL